MRRLRHEAGGPRAPARQDRGAARARGRGVSIDPAAQLRHELRTPLNHIIGYAEMLLEDVADGPGADLASELRALHADARQLLALLNEVLGPAAASGAAGVPGQPGPVDLTAARGRLMAPLDRIRAAGRILRERA